MATAKVTIANRSFLGDKAIAQGLAVEVGGIAQNIGKQLADEIKEKISRNSGGGRVYVRTDGGATRTVKASASGEPPIKDLGNLYRSIGYEVNPRGRGQVEILAGVLKEVSARVSPFQYGAFLEFGTSDMAPRPFIRPVAAAAKVRLTAVLGAAIRKFLVRRRGI